MDRAVLHDTDILIWSEQQAAALRSLASHRDLPNDLDLANVIEEIEDVGRSEIHAVESLLEKIPVHWSCWLPSRMRQQHVGGFVAWNLARRGRISPFMPGRLDIGILWCDALHIAEARLASWDQAKAAAAATRLDGTPCPFAATEFGTDAELSVN